VLEWGYGPLEGCYEHDNGLSGSSNSGDLKRNVTLKFPGKLCSVVELLLLLLLLLLVVVVVVVVVVLGAHLLPKTPLQDVLELERLRSKFAVLLCNRIFCGFMLQ
jgi:hypothetical protein